MSSSPLSVAFLWHMHQPYYRDPFTGIYRLPWVRLHGTKDYLDMVAVLEEFPDIKQTFNLVPSLLEQIIDYTDNGAQDAFLEVTLKKASELTDDERVFLLEKFFLANWDTMVRPFPRYYELLLKRGLRFSRTDLRRTIRYFTDSDFLDLQVLFNLTWMDPIFRTQDPFLGQLVAKGKKFTEDEKRLLVEKQFSLLRAIIPKYRELSQRGQIEISTTPFYHPILPLLWDTNTARDPVPDAHLPKRRFAHPEDARKQIQMAMEYYEAQFRSRPRGMWPSEGSVSEDVVRAFHEAGIQWIATDEDILARSLREGLRGSSGNVLKPDLLYSAYEYSGVSMIFRDHKISDLLGFVYSGWDPKSAAEDLINRLLQIQSSLPQNEPHVVPIILDGENAWEYYRNDGNDFFRYLYEGLSKNERLKTTTVSEFLEMQGRRRKLEHLAAGSWIYANFNVWIGHEEDNTSWDYLTETREALEVFQRAHPEQELDSAWKSLYVAEGSDWNWWYGDEHSTELGEEFDELYRLNLMKVYKEMGKDVPQHLYVPVLREDRTVAPAIEIRGFIHPRIDGIMTSYFEWYQGAHIEVGKSGGSMHMTEGLISRIYYGFNQDTLFIRVDPKESFDVFPEGSVLSVEISRPFPFRVDIPLSKGATAKLFGRSDGEWSDIREITDVALDEILECAIPFRDIKAKERDELNIFIMVRREDEQFERCPWRGYITVTLPTPDFEAMMWH
ncbi:MAG: glycoside hydrolase family 57 protein [Nitrospirae bacterium]|nr:glycoside hydrolase family 57 protein [Nitrospirota bacterium]MCL5421151.1 glycoside hydrolase family 57 protein [Nitrospirota bacterium]